MNKISLITLCFSVFWTFRVSAQEIPQIIPPSPNAASITKYAEMPVSAYTGLPTISIPIYEVTSKDITIPISLSYHAGGIRVDEEASWVGLGWTLHAGGAITRTVMNQDDFDPAFNYFNQTVPAFPAGYMPAYNYDLGCIARMYNPTTASGQEIDLSSYLTSSATDPYEFEPDQYAFNFLDYSGKFILERNYQAVLANQKKMTIQPDPSGNEWTIITEDGFQFEFNKFESYTDNHNSRPVHTAWYLTKIISTTGEEVTFHYYEDQTYSSPVGSVYQEERFAGTTGSQIPNDGQTSSGSPSGCQRDPVKDPINEKRYKNVTLSYIDFRHGQVRFEFSPDPNDPSKPAREDLEGGKRLDRIKIYKKALNGTIEANPFKEFVFTYDYFIGAGDDDITFTDGYDSLLSTRLKLLSLQEKSSTESKGAHKFYYYEGNSFTTLPCKASFARDHWGYYNGAHNNSTLIPEFKGVLDRVLDKPQYVELEGANREPNEMFAKAFTLKAIEYPTGGSATFEYEIHDFDLAKSLINDHSPAPPQTYIKNTTKPLDYDIMEAGTVISKTLDLSNGYVPEGNAMVEVNLDAVFRLSNPGTSIPAGSGKAYFALYGPTGTRVSLVDIADATYDGQSSVYQYVWTYQLAPGVYTWKAYIASDVDYLQQIKANYHFEEELAPTSDGKDLPVAGGLRLSTMVTKDGLDASKDIHRKFVYNYQIDQNGDGVLETLSHGRRMSRPINAYFRNHKDTYLNGSNIHYECWWFIRTAISNVPLNGTAAGSAVGYDEVTVLYGKDGFGNYGIGGKTVYQYENHPDVILNYSFFRPAGLSNLTSNRNGLLKKQIDYAFHLGEYHMVREVTNDYLPSKNIHTVYALKDEVISYPTDLEDCGLHLFFYPTLHSEWIQLGSTTEKVYDLNSPVAKVETMTTYQYETTPVHYQTTGVTTVDSQNRSRTIKYKYAADYSDNTLGSDLLRNHHVHNQKVESETWIGSSANVINKTRTAFSEVASDDPSTKYILPSQVTTYLDGQSESAKVNVMYTYDSYGNIVQVEKENDVPTSYIWGYNHSRPVAQVIGATYADAVAKVNLSSLQSMDGDNLRTELDKLRTLSEALVTTYTYDPLTGMTTVTDPSGLTTHFEYDDLQRLILIKDFQGNRISQYQYQYRAQP